LKKAIPEQIKKGYFLNSSLAISPQIFFRNLYINIITLLNNPKIKEKIIFFTNKEKQNGNPFVF
jgi:hypothetical protein